MVMPRTPLGPRPTRLLDLGVAVRDRDEPGLELRRRQQDALVQHGAEEPGIRVAVRGQRLGGVARCPVAEEER